MTEVAGPAREDDNAEQLTDERKPQMQINFRRFIVMSAISGIALGIGASPAVAQKASSPRVATAPTAKPVSSSHPRPLPAPVVARRPPRVPPPAHKAIPPYKVTSPSQKPATPRHRGHVQ